MQQLHEIQLCRGFSQCRHALVNSTEETQHFRDLHKELSIIQNPNPASDGHQRPFNISIALCPNACTRPQIADIGVIAVTRPVIQSNCCTGCGECISGCRENALQMDLSENPYIGETCIACGECIHACSYKAILAEERGYRVLLGGRLGRHPHLAVDMGRTLQRGEVLNLFTKIYHFWLENRNPGERLRDLMNRRELP